MISNKRGSVSVRTILLLLANVGMLVWILSARASASKPSPSYSNNNTGGYTATPSTNEDTGKDLIIPGVDDDEAVAVQTEPPHQEEKPDSNPQIESNTETSDPIPDEKLNLQMFDWYESHVRYNWFPEDATQLTELQDILGDWKAWVKYDPNNESGNPGDLLAYINIDPGQNQIAATCYWYWSRYQNNPDGNYESGQSHFYGSFEDGQLYTEGPGVLHIKYFCEYNGTQYGVGMMQTKEGVKAIICLMRP